MPESNPDISMLRQAIDEMDEKILDLINRRLLLAQQIGDVKQQSGIQITDHRREKDIMDRLLRTNNGPLDANGLQRIFQAIIDAGRTVQKQIEGQND